ncbi:uncharacterized protein LOC117805735 [Notolabrus celidotus]|uniref:uncharacterized protein LOC117805735 n=1 Tax=Notolabrus celidotus TaxID=1203425 RepID=UPI0014900C84|nr:uncharacterized protein LOC117805735 [Notolabrus celidotus]
MLCGFFLFLFLCADTVECLITDGYFTALVPTGNTWPPLTTDAKLSSLQLVATPDHPVSAGQAVHLHCSASSTPKLVIWSWQSLKNQTWKDVGNKRDLTLSKPEQSGLYRCRAKSYSSSWKKSLNHTVFIIAIQPTVGENLGIAAFALVLLVLMINLTVLSWMGWKKFGDKMNTTMTEAKVGAGHEKPPKGGLQQTDTEGEVYMNYTNTNQAYSDLDPASMTDDNVYSSLS